MKNLKVIIMSLTILVFSILFIIMPKASFSDSENRYLEKPPVFNLDNLFSGKYTNDVKEYLEDHFPFRTSFMNIRTQTFKLLGFSEINGVYMGEDGYLIEKYETVDNISELVNNLDNVFSEYSTSLMLIPTSIVVNSHLLPKYVTNNQLEDMLSIYNKTKLNTINVIDSFLQSPDNLFFKTDHHYNIFGAYLAYRELCNHLELECISEADFELVSSEFLGTLYSKTLDSELEKDKIYKYISSDKLKVNYVYKNKVTDTLYNEEWLGKKDKYSYYLDGNHPLIVVENIEIDSREELVVIKDSYFNSVLPFLIKHYKKIHIIDPRFYTSKITDYINELKDPEVLLFYNMNSLSSDKAILNIK